MTLREFAIAALGVFPNDVLRYLETLGISLHQDVNATSYRGPRYDPELHPLEGEWYFTTETAKRLSSLVEGPNVLCLGTPTVAVTLAAAGTHVVLVDHNRMVARRFRPLPSHLHLVVADATTPIVHPTFDSVFFDAPWYEPEMMAWLTAAVSNVRPGGLIAFPLFPELLRPSAAAERARIFAAARMKGTVTVDEGEVCYDTPLFETRSLAAAGVFLDGPWRQADLLRLRVHGEAVREAAFPVTGWLRDEQEPKWDTFVIGTQVVKLRCPTFAPAHAHQSSPALGVVEGLSGYEYASVSRRDPHRSAIDLWTSRNRVAAVYEHATVKAALALLSEASQPVKPVWLAKSSGLSERDAEGILDLLELGRRYG